MFTIGLFPILFLALIVITILKGVKTVPQGEEWTVQRFGRYTETLSPGLHLIIPFVDSIGAKINMMENVLDVPSQEIITKDNAMVTVDGVVFYQIFDAARAAYEVKNLSLAVMNLTQTNLRTVMGSMDLDELLSQRGKINTQLLHVVDEATSPWGIKVTRIEVRDIQPPRDLVDSMARQMKAERDRRATITVAEGDRQAAILRAEGEKQSAILQSEGRREAAFRDAEARERAAEAEGEATRLVSNAISDGNIQAVNYFIAQQYMDALKKLAASPNQKVWMLPMETSGVIASLGGIADLMREAGGPVLAKRPAPPPQGRTPQPAAPVGHHHTPPQPSAAPKPAASPWAPKDGPAST
jgi:regulator of protease activity HflC (stomatin/prohibitin superfamily)